MKLILSLLVVCALAATAAASCPSSQQDLSTQLANLATAVQQKCPQNGDANEICKDGSQCVSALVEFFSFLELCSTQLEGANVNFGDLKASIQALFDAICSGVTGPLFPVVFAGCPNAQPLVSAAQTVVDKCSGQDAHSTCSNDCRSALQTYYNELFKCFSPSGAATDVTAVRESLEHLCDFISETQACTQTVAGNIHRINSLCSTTESWDCSDQCKSALESAKQTASTKCPDHSALLLQQYLDACEDDCGPNLNEDFNAIADKCPALKESSPAPGECDDCISAINKGLTDADCLGANSVTRSVLSLLKVLAAQACSLVDVSAKKLSDTDVFSDLAVEASTRCRSQGLCSHECSDAITDLADAVYDQYKSDKLPVPSTVSSAVSAIQDFCAAPFVGYPFRTDLYLKNVICDDLLDAATDFITRFAILLGVDPDSLLITDCTDTSTRAALAFVTVASVDSPSETSASDCSQVGLECTSVVTSTSSASSLVLSSFAAFFVLLSLLF